MLRPRWWLWFPSEEALLGSVIFALPIEMISAAVKQHDARVTVDLTLVAKLLSSEYRYDLNGGVANFRALAIVGLDLRTHVIIGTGSIAASTPRAIPPSVHRAVVVLNRLPEVVDRHPHPIFCAVHGFDYPGVRARRKRGHQDRNEQSQAREEH